MKIQEYADRDMLAINVANALAGELENSLLVHETASFAVPGGTTPGPIFDMLASTELDWARVHVLLTDERWVDESSDQSNARLLRTRLLTSRAASATFTPYFQVDKSVQDAATALSGQLAPQMPLSVLVLGMGADMHTASLFPGAEGLVAAMASDAPLVAPISVPGHNVDRITLTAHVLDGALSKHLVIYGDEKRAALEKSLSLPPEKAPIAAVLSGATVHWAA